jgi:hypothetical protein
MTSTPPVTATPTVPGQAVPPYFREGTPGDFARSFDRVPFSFRHHLAGDPRFAYPRIVELVERLSQRQEYGLGYNVGKVKVGHGWGETSTGERTAAEVARDLAHSDGWMILFFVDRDPEFAEVLTACLDEIEALTGAQLKGQVYGRKAEVFISSPGRVTNYHVDYEANWLIQLQGTKTVYVFDPRDKEVLSDQELEGFYRGNRDAPVYKEHLQSRGVRHVLTPGTGVHMPVNAPHWVQNGPEISISIAFNLEMRWAERRGMIHRCNSHLRRLGLSPRSPDPFGLIDRTKALGMRSLISLKELRSGKRKGSRVKYN